MTLNPSPALQQAWQAWQIIQEAHTTGELRGHTLREIETWARRTGQSWTVATLRRFLGGIPLEQTRRLLLETYRQELDQDPTKVATILWLRCGNKPDLWPQEPWATEVRRRVGVGNSVGGEE